MDQTYSETTLAKRFPHRARCWRLRQRTLHFGRRPLLMGVVNVTPDSFSDGGRYFSTAAAIERGLVLADQGADIVDVGGESTRPSASPVAVREELRRVMPVVEQLCRRLDVPVSIDTSHAAVARAAVEAGVEIINDVTALTGDLDMLGVVRKSGVGVCVMHMQGTPQTMQQNPHYDDVVEDIFRYLKERRDELLSAGIEANRICLDPGIGFGKTHQHNLMLLAHCGRLHALGCPMLVGHSRKGFIAKVLGDSERDRTAGTIGTALTLARNGVQVIRVHDVVAVHDALLLFEATGGIDGRPTELDSSFPEE